MLLPSHLDGDKNCRSSKARQAESEPRKTKGQEERPAKEEKLSKHKLVGNQNESKGGSETCEWPLGQFSPDPLGVALAIVAYFSALVIFICLLTSVLAVLNEMK